MMSLNNTKYNIIFSIIWVFLAVAITLAGCKDDIIFTPVDIPDAEVEIHGKVTFKPLVATEIKTRGEAPEGEQYKGIKSLYVFFFDSKGELVEDYSGEVVDFKPTPSEGSTHEHVTFTKKVRAGQYYIYAVANISNEQKNDFLKKVMAEKTIDTIKKYPLKWDDDIENDLEMFGVFKPENAETATVPGNDDFEAAELITVNKTMHIHSWVRRAASKVTIDFDGTNLKPGVTVYIKKARLVDVASHAYLGEKSWVIDETDNETEKTAQADEENNSFKCIPSEYYISYGEGEEFGNWPSVTKTNKPDASSVLGNPKIKSFHDDLAKALPCYENMQGTHKDKSKLQDSNGDGIIDSTPKDGVVSGTFLEVEGYYVSARSEYKSQGKIIYRFMLGKDAVNNFDLIRNHHYQITMQFKGYGNDVDWHIEYSEKYLDATYPKDVNYKGEFFVPDVAGSNYQSIPNGGHTFDKNNVITVTSFMTDGTSNKWIEPEITYTYYVHDDKTGKLIPDDKTGKWLTLVEGDVVENKSKQYTYTASMADPTDKTIKEFFPSKSEGTKDKPYNLSNENGEDMTVINTANCYIVGASGWYCFPLVYGNAIKNKDNNSKAYSNSFVNHLNKPIKAPYIKDKLNEVDLSNVSVKLIWQDVKDLVVPTEIIYDETLFNNNGGIKFHIPNIEEGNAVIALIDNSSAAEDKNEKDHVEFERETYGKTGSTKAIWSWHIWATRFGFDDFEKDITVTNRNEQEFDVMPVNLGWCSGGKAIKYYKRRMCEIKFKVGDNEIIRTIEQYPHFILPRGDHPYYQWGRKDPFVGTNLSGGNKPRWTSDGDYEEWSQYNPARLFNEPEREEIRDGKTVIIQDWKEDKRLNTTECLYMLIKNPDKWHNSNRQPKGGPTIDPLDVGFESMNDAPDDLWSLGGNKTVYDPCPHGYQVGDTCVFSGFIYVDFNGFHTGRPVFWYDVLESDMPEDYYGSKINSQVMELYTSPKKLQSITFPVTGYRDYDNKAAATSYPTDTDNGIGFVWYSTWCDKKNSYHFKFDRDDIPTGGNWKDRGSVLDPKAYFYNTDGMAVRPVRSPKE